MDFPANPFVGQTYTNIHNTTYTWDGFAWLQTIVNPIEEAFLTLNGLLSQIRILLQDTDLTSGAYRYSTNSIVLSLNQGLIEMFRMRPDIFLETGFVVPTFSSDSLDADIPIEQQWVPPLVYYAVGMTQMRDDEGTQDARASGFLTKFTSTLLALA